MFKKHINNKINKINYSTILDDMSNIVFYKKITFKIIEYIKNNDSASVDEILAFVGGGERRIVRLLEQMTQLKIIKLIDSKFIIPKTLENNKLNTNYISSDQVKSRLFNIDEKYKKMYEFIDKVIKMRPKSTFIYDQRPVNIETIISRVAYVIWRGDLQNKRIVLIGDDDLTSIALAWTHLAKEITVFDIDERLLNLIKDVSKSNNLHINVVKQDLLKKLPIKYINHYDTFVTDPTPTVKPLALFTNRGLEMLINKPGKIGYISLYPSHMDMSIDYQKILSRMNILITDLVPFFNQYEIINHTLTQTDMNLLKKFQFSKKCISFYEYWMRIETTILSKPIKLQISQIDLVGKATKQILKDPSKDPAISDIKNFKLINNSINNLRDIIKNKVK